MPEGQCPTTVGGYSQLSSTPPPRFPGHDYPQVIPQPDEVRPGRAAPWAHLEPSQRRGLTTSRVLERLGRAGRNLDGVARQPGELAEARNAARITRRSAVLVALFDEAGEAHVVLTRRAFFLRSHRGEIALPGGAIDEGEDPVAAALREADEEVGLAPELVRPVAWLSPLVTFASSSAIWPIVGGLTERPRLSAQPSEVDRVFTVSLAELVAEGNFLEERWARARPGADAEGFVPIFFYRVPGDVIWGATARVLTELLCLVLEVPAPETTRLNP